MRNHGLFAIVFCLLTLLLIELPEAKSSPQTTKGDYTDFLPKYRTLAEGFLLSKIDYTEGNMIVFFRYVANKDNDVVTFHGEETEYAWKLTTATRSQSSSLYSITRLGSVQNIRVNDESHKAVLGPHAKETLSIKRGDILTCEMHFKTLPRTIRTVHLLGGDVNRSGDSRFNCSDILIKTKESNLLGNREQMEASIKRFYSKQAFVNYPDIKDVTTVKEQKSFSKKEETTTYAPVNPLEKALEPIDYMPKSLSSMDDLACSERVILTNVYFHDNKAEFAGRLKAIKTINVIVEYLNFYPKAKIVLHGHTDIFGNPLKNLELSRKRVALVKRTIALKGIDANRIITIHHGGEQPLVQYRQGGELNRRVEAEILCSGASKFDSSAAPSANK